jgi:hypothetical protein
MRSIVPAMLTVSCLLGMRPAAADSLTDLMGPREIAVGEGLRGSATGASAIGLNPAGLPLNRELVFEGGYGWRGTDDATLIGVSACDSTNAAPGCFFYDYLGTNPELAGMTGTRTTHVGGMALSKLLLPRVMVGATVKYFSFKSDMAGEMSQSGFVADFGATLRLTQMINLGFAGMNIYSSKDQPAMFPRAGGGGLHARPMPNPRSASTRAGSSTPKTSRARSATAAAPSCSSQARARPATRSASARCATTASARRSSPAASEWQR